MNRPRSIWGVGALATMLLMAAPAFADDAPPKLDSGDTAWMLASTALVLLMTIPGLALFYAGMVRKKNILATMMQSFTICCIVTIVWMVAGYSIAFTTGNAYMGDFSRIMLRGIADHIVKGNDSQAFVLASGIKDVADMATTIPETVYMMFQMTFAIITPALIAGAFADRMKFSAMCLFMALWSLLVYSPIAHWVWAPSGWANQLGVLDFAGGTVVHINAGVAGLVCALVLGKREGYPQHQHGTVQPGLRGHRRLFAVGRLVRVQRRFRGCGERTRGHGHVGDTDRHRGGRSGLDVRGVDRQGQTVGARRGVRCGRGSRGHHPGIRLRAARVERS